MNTKPKAYGPRSVAKEKPVQMRLVSEERREFERLCREQGGSESSIARAIYLAGLPVWLAQQQQQAAA
ncbi:hypothetical protein DBR44_00380 [Aquitalea sp. FJL05]|nr:hypothetical protein DBR44_00380 [Aquitalea sp. FJL05]